MYLVVICISLVTSGVEHIFLYLFEIHIFVCKRMFKALSFFFLSLAAQINKGLDLALVIATD